MKFSTLTGTLILGFGPLTALAAPAQDGNLLEHRDSGCHAFIYPSCCIKDRVCQCANGWFYKYNPTVPGGCNPPWGFLTTSMGSLQGFCCRADIES